MHKIKKIRMHLASKDDLLKVIQVYKKNIKVLVVRVCEKCTLLYSVICRLVGESIWTVIPKRLLQIQSFMQIL